MEYSRKRIFGKKLFLVMKMRIYFCNARFPTLPIFTRWRHVRLVGLKVLTTTPWRTVTRHTWRHTVPTSHWPSQFSHESVSRIDISKCLSVWRFRWFKKTVRSFKPTTKFFFLQKKKWSKGKRCRSTTSTMPHQRGIFPDDGKGVIEECTCTGNEKVRWCNDSSKQRQKDVNGKHKIPSIVASDPRMDKKFDLRTMDLRLGPRCDYSPIPSTDGSKIRRIERGKTGRIFE